MAGLRAWRDLLVDHQRTLECRGGLPAETGPDELALAMLAALQGGLLLARVFAAGREAIRGTAVMAGHGRTHS